jgi:hypothetical protein
VECLRLPNMSSTIAHRREAWDTVSQPHIPRSRLKIVRACGHDLESPTATCHATFSLEMW